MDTQQYLHSLLKGYYSSVQVNSVPDISAREFGIGEFGRKISNRHLAFRSSDDLNFFLRERAPFYISYSNAHYEFPEARPMEKKSLVGADLIYEFDADDIKTDCKLEHDSWCCKSCGAKGKGNIRECPECGSGVKVEEWSCPECIGETKRQTKVLLSLLEKDFSFNSGVSVNFSGSKGFHVHVRGKEVQALSKQARLEVLDYITGTNIDLKSQGFFYDKPVFFSPKRMHAGGWAKKILDSLVELFDEGDPVKVASMASRGKHNFTVRAAGKLLKEKPAIMNGVERGFLVIIPRVNSEAFWNSLLQSLAEQNSLDVDRQTSVDINKIIRVPNTIHGSTGLLAKEIPLKSLDGFDAFRETVVLSSEEVKIKNAVCPRFVINGEQFGPFKGEEVSLPGYAAYYLLGRGNAELGG